MWRIIVVVVGIMSIVVGIVPSVQAASYSCGGYTATIVGTPGNDTLTGTAGRDVIVGLGGNDIISGLEGSDIVCGNEGQDVIYGNQGNDLLYGGQGDDKLYGGQDQDQLFGNLGRDFLEGNLGTDILNGNEERDTYSATGATQLGTIDMKAYCRAKHGTGETERDRDDIYSWACEFKEWYVGTDGAYYRTYTKPIDIEDACLFQWKANTFPVALNIKDAYSWRCFKG